MKKVITTHEDFIKFIEANNDIKFENAQEPTSYPCVISSYYIDFNGNHIMKYGEIVTLEDFIIRNNIDVKVETITPNEHYNVIDLGLPSGTKWCDRNIGASSPEDNGFYFAWGETDGYTKNDIKSDNCIKKYNWNNYKFGNCDELSKYNKEDKKKVLDSENDAACVNMGGDWRMPTKEDFDELLEYTTNKWVKDYNGTGVSGRLFTSKVNGNSIFVPAAGCANDGSVFSVGFEGNLWSSSLNEDDADGAWNLGCDSDYANADNYDGRFFGFPVRAVLAQ